jgi:hypothetical protein
MDLSDCRCVRCDAGGLSFASDLTTEIHREAITCRTCRATYDSVWGVPFIGHFERDDFLSLVEIAANADDYHHFSSSMLDRWEEVLHSYHEAADKDAFSSRAGYEDFPGITCYNEWVEVVSLTKEIIGSLRGS